MGRAVSSVVRQGVNLVKEGVNRFIGIPGAVLGLIGIRWPMKMRLRVVILRDENGELVAEPEDVMPSIEEAREIFRREANVRMQPADNEFILPVPSPAPSEALYTRCSFGAFRDEITKAGRYFKRYTARSASSFFVGYATPLTIFIVKEIEGPKACALGPSVSYAIVSVDGLESRRDSCGTASEEPAPGPPDEEDDDDPPIVVHGGGASVRSRLVEKADDLASVLVHEDEKTAHRHLAHEIGHMCGLSPFNRHSSNCTDLMHTPPGTRLTRRRKAVIVRNSRFVTTF
ncbi:hypothetical protein [Natronorarus salvus]|uniref:hypothetical protein n=1 Tax=Natronorarus salvus TaxID=3117733 RepID=UPI002F26C2D4